MSNDTLHTLFVRYFSSYTAVGLHLKMNEQHMWGHFPVTGSAYFLQGTKEREQMPPLDLPCVTRLDRRVEGAEMFAHRCHYWHENDH